MWAALAGGNADAAQGSALEAPAVATPAPDEAPSFWQRLAQGELSGFVAVDSRWFFEPALHPGQNPAALNPGILAQPEYRYEWNEGHDRLTLAPFGRLDFQDERRRHWDVREASWLHTGEGWDFRFGVGKVFWGVCESNHLVDIVNQEDLIEDIDGEDKLGQPMLQLSLFRRWGTVELFFMPRFRERTFAGRKGRLRFNLPIATGQPSWDSSLREWHPDGAIRWSRALGAFDVGVSHFSGTGREPRFFLRLRGTERPQLLPRYDVIHQTSIDVQATTESWLWKLEAMTRGGQGDRFAALVGGFEYTFYSVFRSAADVGVLAEYSYDGRDTDVPLETLLALRPPPAGVPPIALPTGTFSLGDTPPTFLDNDIFAGIRISPNDEQSTEFLAGGVVDIDTRTAFVFVEVSRRIRERWKVELDARIFANVAETDILFDLRNDSFLQLRIARYF
jgi:hypothetical protein